MIIMLTLSMKGVVIMSLQMLDIRMTIDVSTIILILLISDIVNSVCVIRIMFWFILYTISFFFLVCIYVVKFVLPETPHVQ